MFVLPISIANAIKIPPYVNRKIAYSFLTSLYFTGMEKAMSGKIAA